MPRTDRILVAIRQALERQRPALDTDCPLGSVTVVVRYADRIEEVIRDVVVRTEARGEVVRTGPNEIK